VGHVSRDRVQGQFLFGKGGPGCLGGRLNKLTLGGEVVGSLGIVVWGKETEIRA